MTDRTQSTVPDHFDDVDYRREYGAEDIKYEMARALVSAREQMQVTQASLATLVGVSQAYIARLESGDANPTIGQIGGILAALWTKSRIQVAPLAGDRGRRIADDGEASLPSQYEDVAVGSMTAQQ